MSNMRFRTQTYAPEPRATSEAKTARNVMILALIIFVIFSSLIMFAGKLPIAPQFQTEPVGLTQQLNARDAEILTSYAWIDRENGVVRIPIDQAMQLTAERGLPTREQAPAGSETP